MREKTKILRRVILFFTVGICLTGCASKQCEPLVITEYKEVYKPVKCQAKLPIKPVYDKNRLESAKEVMRYYVIVESRFKHCIGIKSE